MAAMSSDLTCSTLPSFWWQQPGFILGNYFGYLIDFWNLPCPMANSSFPLKPGPSTVLPISGNSNCNLLLLGPTLLESSLTPLSFSHSAFKSIRKYCWFYLENKPKIWPLSQHCCYYDHTQSHSPSLLIWVIKQQLSEIPTSILDHLYTLLSF